MKDFLEGQLLLINKPLEWTSFDVVKKIRNVLRSQLQIKKIKVGHAGTLDPLAEGLLIVCTGKFTKHIDRYQAQVKEYTGEFVLGATTPSYDLETSIDQHYSVEHITKDNILEAAQMLSGEILQTPPIYSAIKQNGKRLYEHARNGQEVNIKQRLIEVSEFKITKIDIPKVQFRIVCSKGTYIRSIAHSFGKKLDSGAYLNKLTRTRIGPYSLSQAIDIQEFIDSFSKANNPDTTL